METHRIKVKLGDAEFDAEGKPEAVQAQYDAFLKLVAARPKPEPEPAPKQNLAQVKGISIEIADVALDRIFRRGDVLSLAALPNGEGREADAMLALLYGYAKLQNEQSVTGTMLRKSALVSGVNIERADRVMNGLIPDFVMAGGVKKAKRYQLNNQGLARAESVIRTLLQ